MTDAAAPSILLAIPVYNHPATIRDVVERCLAAHDRVLVVDDGSADPVQDALAGLPVTTVRHPVNLGKGEAIRTAARWAREHSFTHLVTIDADGQHDPAQFPRFAAAIAKSPDAIVIGVRDFGADVPRLSRFGRAFGNFWVRLQTGLAAGDIQSGYRAYPVRALTELHCWSKRFAFEVEIVVRSAWAGVPIEHLDIPVHYPSRQTRVSHFRLLMDNLRLSLLNAHLTMRSIVPWPHPRLFAPIDGEKVSALHPVASIRRLLRQSATPSGLGMATALGVLLGTLPLVAMHTVSVLFATNYLRLNRPAAVAASQLCMPPLVPALCIEVGHYLRHGQWLTELSWQVLGEQILQRLWEYVIGAIVLAPVLAIVAGLLVWLLALGIRRVRPEASPA